MDTRAYEYVRSEYSDRSLQQLLDAPVTSLLGVSSTAADQLRLIGIRTVFDLGTSRLFGSANEILLGSVWASGTVGLSEHVPGDLVDEGQREIALAALAQSPLSVLRIVGDATGQALSDALGVSNIREFALWPPYRAARSIVSQTYGGTNDDRPVVDPESPPELVPGARQLPTERIQYDVLMLDKIWDPASDDAAVEELTIDGGGVRQAGGRRAGRGQVTIARPPADAGRALEAAGQLDLTALAANSVGFTGPATGALLTYTQSWFPEGLALGQLLHSVALAPGESTRLAMIDWSRRSSSTTSEGISETELLTSDLERARSISEIVSAVATEAQQGFSSSFGGGFGTSVGTASGGAGSYDFAGGGGGGGAGGGGGGAPAKVAGGSGESTGMGFGVGGAQSSGWTTGQRNLSANMAQNIMDRTHQASNSSRNRKATIVREATQSESERIGTRTVTNYNHMHALSIQYFETVQLYRVAVELAKVTACLFVPMKLLDFTRVAVVARYKRAIAAAGLIPAVRALQRAETDTLIVSSPSRRANWNLGALAAMFGESIGDPADSTLAFPLNFYPMSLDYSEDAPFSSVILEFSNGSTTEIPVVTNQNTLGKYHVDLLDKYGPTIDKAAPFWDIASIRARKRPDSQGWSGDVTFTFRMVSLQRDGFPKPQGGIASGFVSVRVSVPARDTSPVLFDMSRTVSGRDLRQHLLDNQLYYSQAIWRMLDSVTIGQILAAFTFGGRPVLSIVDPLPLTVAANYLVFRKHQPKDAAAEKAWNQWLVDQDIIVGEREDDIVPLPSGGVFAEAVLGRFNSAEKLDITRFWNWQDSPIPITPTEIGAIQSGSRAQPEDLRPSQLSTPALTIQLPPGEPDPQGLTAILAAIQNGNMFRDMSGMAGTIGFAQTAMTRAFDAARDAAAQAGENMKTAADIYKSAFGGQGGGQGPGASNGRNPSSSTTQSPRTISNAGARINYGEQLDGRSPQSPFNLGGGGTSPGGTGAQDPGIFQTPGGTPGMPQSQSMASQAFMTDLGSGDPYGIQQVGWQTNPSGQPSPMKAYSGEAAAQYAAELLKRAVVYQSPSGGPYSPGTIWFDKSMLLEAQPQRVIYLKGDDLYYWEVSPEIFLRSQELNAFVAGVSSAQMWVTIGQVELSFLIGLCTSPLSLPIALIGDAIEIIGAMVIDSGLKLYANRAAIQPAFEAASRAASAALCIRRNAPRLWSKMESAAFWAIITNLPREINAKTIGFWAGRIIRAIGKKSPALVFSDIMLEVAKITGIVLALHAPEMAGLALEEAIDQQLDEMKQAWADQGSPVTDDEARAIFRELDASPQAMQCLATLRTSVAAMQPLIGLLVPEVVR